MSANRRISCVVALSLASLLVLGCGGTKESKKADEPAAAAEPAPEPEAAPAAEAKPAVTVTVGVDDYDAECDAVAPSFDVSGTWKLNSKITENTCPPADETGEELTWTIEVKGGCFKALDEKGEVQRLCRFSKDDPGAAVCSAVFYAQAEGQEKQQVATSQATLKFSSATALTGEASATMTTPDGECTQKRSVEGAKP